MKLCVEVGRSSYLLELMSTLAPGHNEAGQDETRPDQTRHDDTHRGAYRYSISGAETATGSASVLEVMPGVYSILDGCRSFMVTLVETKLGTEAWVENRRYLLSVSDPRDRGSQLTQAGHGGPLEVRALMPGKVIRVLVEPGRWVSEGEGLVVVEAMKMQNEMKAPREGTVTAIPAIEGATVAAGATLIVLE